MRKHALTLAVAATVTLLAACGSDSKGAADTTTASTAAETTAPETTTADGTVAPETTTDGTTAGSVNPEFADYCAQIQSYKDETNAMDSLFGGSDLPSVDDMKAAFGKVQQMLQDLEDKAPAEIKADVATVNAATTDLINFFIENDYDFTKIATDTSLATEFQGIIDNSDASDAGDRLDQWGQENCGIDPEA